MAISKRTNTYFLTSNQKNYYIQISPASQMTYGFSLVPIPLSIINVGSDFIRSQQVCEGGGGNRLNVDPARKFTVIGAVLFTGIRTANREPRDIRYNDAVEVGRDGRRRHLPPFVFLFGKNQKPAKRIRFGSFELRTP